MSSQPKPAYLRLYETLREQILSGAWPWGARIPSKRATAEKEGVSVITAEHAYALLCEEGYLQARQRSGYYVLYRRDGGYFAPAAQHPAAARPAPRLPRETFPFSVLAGTMRKVLQDQRETLLVKAPGEGIPELRAAIAHYLQRSRGFSVAPAQIIIGSGAEYLYGLIVRLLGRDRVYAAEDPSYEKIARVYRAEGVRCDMLRLGKTGILSEDLWAARASVLHVTPYHSFPSGVTADASKRAEYVHWAADRPDRYLVEDDFSSEFSLSGKPTETLFALAGGKRVLYVNTFSLTIAPSLRAGYLVLPEALLPVYRERAGFYSCPVPAFEQYVLQELLDSGSLERHINRVRRRLRTGI